ncbi:hypothetical protein DERF_012549 [Dermatophagoides farinae]|uniref:Uncharacterized protein n=1 Tax=Dermatophagoides farinae TaxID=6954 RepID=A0A922L1U5_DERFA|nr:hypothetical protein DERF_012549 [Dermatophagoides farinae]
MIRNISHMDCSYKIKTRFVDSHVPFIFIKASKQAGRQAQHGSPFRLVRFANVNLDADLMLLYGYLEALF